MNAKKNFKEKIVKGIKSCFKELNLDISNSSQSEGHATINSKIDFGSYEIHIAVSYFVKADIITVILDFSEQLPADRIKDVYDIMNRVNAMLMDIGHFSFCPESGRLLMQTGISVAHGTFDMCQLKDSIARIIAQGDIGYTLISRVALDKMTPDEVWHHFFYHAQYHDDNSNTQLH